MSVTASSLITTKYPRTSSTWQGQRQN